ncbi:hypothetical protein ACIGZH_01920 [Streptomyces sp. NPDC058319]|uniref:hypothetical protein n=1 Tax=unclassified Streptomyces TaxID=2593676 RepID=UPI0036F16E02
MNVKLRHAAEDVIARAMRQGRTVPALIAEALESACLLQSPVTAAELEQLRVRVAELEAERHTTNEALADADAEREKLLRWHREDGEQITKLVAQRERRRARLVALQNDALNMRVSLAPNGEDRKVPYPLGETLTPAVDWLIARVAELEAAPCTVYRAEHPDSGVTLGHYGTAAAARAHCEATERRSWPTGTTLAFDWIEDDEDRVAELMVAAGQNEESTTGYIVTALELDSEYDEGAAE